MPSSARKIAAARANGAESRGPATEAHRPPSGGAKQRGNSQMPPPEASPLCASSSKAGKQISSLNATTHGLTAQTVVLFNESADEYQGHLRDYLLHFGPQTKPEAHRPPSGGANKRGTSAMADPEASPLCASSLRDDLVHQLAAAHWRLARYAGVESGLLEQRMNDQAELFGDDLDGQPEYHRVALAFKGLSGDNSSLSLLNRYQARLHREYQRILKTLLEIETGRPKEAHNVKLQIEPNPEFEHSAADSADAPVMSPPIDNPHSDF